MVSHFFHCHIRQAKGLVIAAFLHRHLFLWIGVSVRKDLISISPIVFPLHSISFVGSCDSLQAPRGGESPHPLHSGVSFFILKFGKEIFWTLLLFSSRKYFSTWWFRVRQELFIHSTNRYHCRTSFVMAFICQAQTFEWLFFPKFCLILSHWFCFSFLANKKTKYRCFLTYMILCITVCNWKLFVSISPFVFTLHALSLSLSRFLAPSLSLSLLRFVVVETSPKHKKDVLVQIVSLTMSQ